MYPPLQTLPDYVSHDEHNERLEQLHNRLQGLSRYVEDTFPSTLTQPPLTRAGDPDQPDPGIMSEPGQQTRGFMFNPLTAIHGEFVPGASGWRPDQRSRRMRAIERNRLRFEEAERESTFADEAVAEVQWDNNQAVATSIKAAPLQDRLAKDPLTRGLITILMMKKKGTDAGLRVLTAALEVDERRPRSGN
ncbi:MAG: hypothetical protein Q9209_006634 [Squamulea sp. 1 TL-2023]